MECLSSSTDEAEPAKAKEPGRLQRWVRAALLGTLTVVCGGGDVRSPDHPHHGNTTENSSLQNAVPPGTDGLPGTFSEERTKDPGLTEEHYLDLLALTLTTPEKLHQFLKTYVKYVFDSPDPDDPLKKGTEDNYGSYWQTPYETIRRVERGQMLGDCEDYALLAQEILRRQGKNAHVIPLPKDKHAMCIWVEKDREGKYQGRRADENGVTSSTKHEKLIDAVECATPHHSSFHPYWIPVCHRVGSFWYVDWVSIHAFDPDLPAISRISGIELAALVALLGGSYGTYRFLRRRREGARGETWKEYFTTPRLH